MKAPIKIDDLRNSACARLNPHLFSEPARQEDKKSKYGNEKVVDDEGRPFDSKRELKRYKELKLLLKAGKIGFLARQTEFELNNGGTHSLIYKADFTYIDMETGKQMVEDVKGHETKIFKKKEKLMKKVHGIIIHKT